MTKKWKCQLLAITALSWIITAAAMAGTRNESEVTVCNLRSTPQAYEGKSIRVRAELVSNGLGLRAIADERCPRQCVYLSVMPGVPPKNVASYTNYDEFIRDGIMYEETSLNSETVKVIATFEGVYRWKDLGNTRELGGNKLLLRSITKIDAHERHRNPGAIENERPLECSRS